MAVLPDTDLARIEFCETHLPVWLLDPPSIGLDPAAVAALAVRTTEARAAYDAALSARQASHAATLTMKDATRAMRDDVADLIRAVKAFAENSASPGTIYAASRIPEPAAPAPLPLPGAPERLAASLNPGGSITLRWKATNAAATSGAVFDITRRIGGSGTYTCIGLAQGGPRGFFDFTDNTIPVGAPMASYIVTGKRGKQSGTPSAAITVQFGVDGMGMAVTGATLKMAA